MRNTTSDIRNVKPTCLCGWLLLNCIEIDLMVIAVVVCTLLQISGNMWQASIRSLIQLQLCRWYGFTLLQAKCIKCHYALQAEHKSPLSMSRTTLNYFKLEYSPHFSNWSLTTMHRSIDSHQPSTEYTFVLPPKVWRLRLELEPNQTHNRNSGSYEPELELTFVDLVLVEKFRFR